MSDNSTTYVSLEDAFSAISRALQWVGEGETPDDAANQAASWLRQQPTMVGLSSHIAADLLDLPKDPG